MIGYVDTEGEGKCDKGGRGGGGSEGENKNTENDAVRLSQKPVNPG